MDETEQLKRTPAMRFVIVAILFVAATSANAQMYRWTDERGRAHFTDMPPPNSAKNVQNIQSVPPTGTPTEPFILQQLRNNYPVTFYSAPHCEPCGEARKLLNARGIPFKEVSVVSPAQFEELKATVGSNAIPALVVGSEVQKGFGETAYHSLLDIAGYPKTGVLPVGNQTEPKPVEPKVVGRAPEPPRAMGPYAPRRGPPTPTQQINPGR